MQELKANMNKNKRWRLTYSSYTMNKDTTPLFQLGFDKRDGWYEVHEYILVICVVQINLSPNKSLCCIKKIQQCDQGLWTSCIDTLPLIAVKTL